MARDRFRDGAGLLATYNFEVNHFTEQATQNTNNLQRTAVTTGVGFVRQQGDPSPDQRHWQGDILTLSQYNAMIAYFAACEGRGTPPRTIFLQDFTGVENEVLLTEFNPVRVWCLSNPRDLVNMPNYYITYDLLFEVIA